ncbi:MAG TPA: type II secretion system F family protein [Phycisphaerae bacterium]|nr:type II secretion system F family protein [Phycisphaerae bacterium]
MVKFQYEALNSAGQVVKDEVEAPTAVEAMGKIRTRGLFPTKVKEAARKTARMGGRSRSISFGGVPVRVMTEFTRQLSTLQDAGLPLVRSLKVLWQQERAGTLKNVLVDVAESVEGGATLSEAMGRHPRAFDRLYVNMVQAGETGGVLDVILQRLADFMEKAQRLKRRIIGAMIYPAVVIAFSALIVLGIMMFVVPKFQEIFRDFRAALPSLTVWLMAVANFIAHDFGWAFILGAPFALWMALKFVARSAGGKLLLDTIKLHLPVMGKIVRKTAVARFSRTLGTLLAAGVPILEAITIARDTVGNAVFERALTNVHNGIKEGETFAATLRVTKVCDAIVTNMIDVGEETGDLDKMLLKIADNYDEQIDVLVGSLVSLLEPVMVVGLGGIVGTIVLALFLPIIRILDSFTNGAQ